MRRILLSACVIILAACTSNSTLDMPTPPVPEPMVAPQIPAVHHAAPAVAPTLDTSISELTPPQLLTVAEQARADAANYVAWKLSKAENIERLTTLTQAVNLKIAEMKAGRINGRYQVTDVIAARTAVQHLRTFLRDKGD